jgi:AsmA protein
MHSNERQGALTGSLSFLILRRPQETFMKILSVIVIVLGLLIVALLSLPFLVDLASYQDHYKPLIEEALNRKIQVQAIRLTIWPRIGARITGFTVMDDPSFSASPFASLSSLDVGVKLWPLLTKKIEVEEITLREPLITVIKSKAGVTNVSTIGPKSPVPADRRPPDSPQPQGDPLEALALLAVDRLLIDGGTVIYRDLSTAPETEYRVQDLVLDLKSVHLGETPTIHFSATTLPQNLPVTLDGSFGPLVQALEIKQYQFTLAIGRMALALHGALLGGQLDAVVTAPSISTADFPVTLPLIRPVEIKDLRIVAKAPYPLKSGASPLALADVTDLTLAVVMGKSSLNVRGKAIGGHARVMVSSPSVDTADLPVESGLKKPVEIRNIEMNADLKGQEVRLSNLSLEVFNGQVKAQGGTSLGTSTPPFNGKLTVQGVQMGQALGAVDPQSPLLISGRAAADVAVAGRGFSWVDLTSALEGPGHVEIKDGKIEGVNLIGEATALLKVAGISLEQAKATAFSTIESDFMIKQGRVNAQKILMDSHDFQATGHGTVGFDQTLNLAMNLNLSQTLTQKIAGSSPLVKAASQGGRLRLPLLITGTLPRPSFALDARGLTGKVQEQVQEKAKDTVEGLMQGTTKPADLKKEGKELLKGLFGR